MEALIIPGSMGVVAHAIDLYGIDRVDPGRWGTGVRVVKLTQEEFDFAVEFFGEYNLKVVEITHG